MKKIVVCACGVVKIDTLRNCLLKFLFYVIVKLFKASASTVKVESFVMSVKVSGLPLKFTKSRHFYFTFGIDIPTVLFLVNTSDIALCFGTSIRIFSKVARSVLVSSKAQLFEQNVLFFLLDFPTYLIVAYKFFCRNANFILTHLAQKTAKAALSRSLPL